MTYDWHYDTSFVPRTYGEYAQVQRFAVPTWYLRPVNHPSKLPRALVQKTPNGMWAVTMARRDGVNGKLFKDVEQAKTYVMALAVLDP